MLLRILFVANYISVYGFTSLSVMELQSQIINDGGNSSGIISLLVS